jgi:pilus assembly protein CpaB
MRGRFSIVLIIAAIAGLLASTLVYRTVAQMRAAATRGPETEDVVVAAANLDVAETVTGRDVKLVPWPRLAIPEGAIRRIADVEGRALRRSVVAGEPLIEAKLAPQNAGRSGVLGMIVPEGQRAMTIRLDDAVRESGLVVPNSRVDVIVSTPRPDGERVGKIILQDVLVLAAGQTVEMRDNKPVSVTTVTLALTPEQAERLALAQTDSKLILVTRNYHDKTTVKTSGATRAALFDGDAAPKAVAAAKPAPARAASAPAAVAAPPAPLPPPPLQTHTVAVLRAGKLAEQHTFVRSDGAQPWTEQGSLREGRKP